MKYTNNTIQPTADQLNDNFTNRLVHAKATLDSLNQFLASECTKDIAPTVSECLKFSGARAKELRVALKELNDAIATEYYCKAESILDVMTAGSVPAVQLIKQDGVITFEHTHAKPTANGLEPFVSPTLSARLDALRRCAAYLSLKEIDAEDAKKVLTGEEGTDKNGKTCMVGAPSKATKEFIPAPEEISNKFVKAHLQGIVTLLSGEKAECIVTSAMLKDFCSFMVRRGSEWGTRTMASSHTVGDIVLEYVHMLLTGKGKFSVRVKP